MILIFNVFLPIIILFYPSFSLSQIVLNIDIAPTLLDMAGIKIPTHMDGISFLPYIQQLSPNLTEHRLAKLIKRDSFLVERG